MSSDHSGSSSPTFEPLSAALVDDVYAELRRAAGALMARERQAGAGQTLQPTALVHEAWIRLSGPDRRWNGRTHFLRTAAQAMRRLLVDRARRVAAERHGGSRQRVDLDAVEITMIDPDVDLLALDDALTALEAERPRQAEIVRLRYFAGLTIDETATALELGRTTVKDDWTHARLWLLRAIGGAARDADHDG